MVAAAWIVAAILALILLALGVSRLGSLAKAKPAAQAAHVPVPIWRVEGILEILGAIGLLVGVIKPVVGYVTAAVLVLLQLLVILRRTKTGARISAVLPAVVILGLLVAYAVLLVVAQNATV